MSKKRRQMQKTPPKPETKPETPGYTTFGKFNDLGHQLIRNCKVMIGNEVISEQYDKIYQLICFQCNTYL